MRSRLIILAWFVAGVFLAANHHYLGHLGTIKAIVSAVLAVILWPLLLLGINLHIH